MPTPPAPPTDSDRIRDLLARYGDGSDGSAPSAAQWRRLLSRPADAPITLINVTE